VIVVSDTSPVRGLISINQIDILKGLFEKILIPVGVKEELLRIHSLHSDIEQFMKQDWVEIINIKDKQKLVELRNFLDSGESEAIVLAIESNCNFILMDENKGRRIAKSLNLNVLGLIGILILAKQKGLITEIKTQLKELREKYGFWISNQFYSNILKSIEEE
jgi:predicted nucleic acid-binding protein